MKQLFWLMLAPALLCAGDGSRYTEDFHYTYPLSAGGHFSLENFNGSVEVTGWDQNNVDISGTKYANSEDLLRAIKVEISHSETAVRIKTEHPETYHGSMGAKYVVHVPRSTQLESITSSNGALRVEEISGASHLHTSNGSIHLARIHGDVDARSSNGTIEAHEVQGAMEFQTSNGGIHADEVSGAFQAETSNGAVNVHLHDTAAGRPIKVETSNGGVDLRLDSPRGNEIIASTSNGGITVHLPSNTPASVKAVTTSTGSVQSDFDLEAHGENSKHRLEGNISGGGPRIDLTTSNGSIHLLRL